MAQQQKDAYNSEQNTWLDKKTCNCTYATNVRCERFRDSYFRRRWRCISGRLLFSQYL